MKLSDDQLKWARQQINRAMFAYFVGLVVIGLITVMVVIAVLGKS